MIITQHNDNQRTGCNSTETLLTTGNVSSESFGKLNEYPVDGSVYAQPLLVPADSTNGFEHDVLIVATMHGTVFAFNVIGSTLISIHWQNHLVDTIQLPAPDIGPNNYGDIIWEVGILSTPVIDTDRGVLWVVTTSRKDQNNPIHQLWRLELSSGSEQASASFQPKSYQSSTFESNLNT